MRLADTTIVSINSIAFDTTATGTRDLIVADFDFRLTPQSVTSRGDGFGFALARTAVFGVSGPLGGEAEEPDLDGSLGVGFDIHQGPGEISPSHVSVHWNAAKLAEFDVTHAIDLANGHFNHARIIVRPGHVPPDVTVIVTPCGSPPITVVDRFVVAGMVPYESRVHFMARSGGQAALHDLDNVSVQFLGPSESVVSFTRPTHAPVESDGVVPIELERVGDTAASVQARLVLEGGTAATSVDYDSSATVVTFGTGETSATASVALVDDADLEGDELFVVRLEPVAGEVVVGGPSRTRVTIVDDEAGRALGHWSAPVCLPIVAIHATLLPSGDVMIWPGEEAHTGTSGGDHPMRWEPASGMVHALAQAGFDLFCSGHTLAADGRVFVAGGHVAEAIGLPNAAFYDPVLDTWEHLPDMNAGRWYPTCTVLPSGDLLVTAGSISEEVMNDLPQVWEVQAQRWRDLTGARLGEPELFRYYPWMYVVDEHRVFCAGWQQPTWSLDPNGTGAWTFEASSNYGFREYGSSVMYEHGKILIVGGNPHDFGDPPTIPPSASTELIDLENPTAGWTSYPPMAKPRRHLNTTLLPDGTVLATGGTSGVGSNNPETAVLSAERWDPATRVWQTVASMTVPRLYHSVALLLPDGRVMSAGGGAPSPRGHLNRHDAEVFHPPYLFRGPRPAVRSAPTAVRFGETFRVDVQDPAKIAAVNLLRHGSVTHAWNAGQRIVPLDFALVADGVLVTVPTDSARCLPGYYMMFLIDDEGVPSEGQIMRVSGPPVVDGRSSGTVGPAIHTTLPNPTAGGIRVSFALPEEGAATLALFDVSGRRIHVEDVGHLGRGNHVIELRSPNEVGLYWLRLEQGGRSDAARVVCIR
jgi:hypothetical protein